MIKVMSLLTLPPLYSSLSLSLSVSVIIFLGIVFKTLLTSFISLLTAVYQVSYPYKGRDKLLIVCDLITPLLDGTREFQGSLNERHHA